MLKNICAGFVLISLLVGCGGGSSSSNESADLPTVQSPTVQSPTVYTGIFVDSAVEGLAYSTNSQSGATDADGTFTFQIDEEITFFIGDIALPTIKADTLLTPLTIFDSQDVTHAPVVNLLRLLQSLDLDGDTSNNIQIPVDTHELAKGLSVDFSAENFDEQVSELIAESEGVYQQLISADEAILHFQYTLAEIENGNINSCEKTHEKVGYSGYFETFHHNVAGKATIIDDCTIEITQFSYDGGGPEVYFYGAIDHKYESDSAFPIGTKLNGTVFENSQFTIKLPMNKSLDDLTGISVWCVDFNADFGHMEFTP